MADLKIRIEGDASGATKALEDVKNSSDFTWKSISQLTTNLQKVDKAFLAGKATAEDLDKAQRQLINAFERFSNAAIIGGNEAKAYSEIVKKANSVIQKLDANVKSVNLSDTFKKAAKEAQKFQNELEKSKATYENTLAKNKATALGDKYTLYSLEYKELDKQLTKILEREGQVTDESKKLASQMVKLKKAMDKAGQTGFGNRINNLIKSFVSAQAILWGVRKAFTFVTQTIKEAGEAASYAEETFNLFIEVFDSVQSKAINTASSIATAFGSATSTIQNGLGVFGDLVIGLGGTESQALELAEKMTTLTMDIASFKNIQGDLSSIFQTTASGIAGNLENFRKMGYIITQAEVNANLAKKGLDGLTGSALQLAQVQERVNILSQKAVKAQGDMVRTLDSTENITRRLSEAWKEYKENLGSDVNRLFNPIKKWWLAILDAQNEVNAVQKEILKNQEDISKVGSLDDADSIDAFATEFKTSLMVNSVDRAIKIMRAYDATLEDVYNNLEKIQEKWNADRNKENYQNVDLDSFMKRLKTELKEADIIKKNKEAEEERLNIIKSQQQALSSFADKLSSIKGINVGFIMPTEKSTKLTAQNRAASVNYMKQLDSLDTGKFFKQVIDSLDGNIEKFSSTIEVALGKVSEADMIENKLSVIKDVYDAFYNRFMEDTEIVANEQEALDKLASMYSELKSEHERKVSFEASLKNVSSMNKTSDLATYGLSGKELDLYNLDAFYEAAKAIASTAEEQKALNRSYLEATKSIDKYYEAVEKQKKADEEATRQKEAAEAEEKRASNAQELIEEWQKKVFQFGMSERTVQQNDLARELIKGTYTDNEYNQIVKYMNEYFDSEEATAKAQEFQDMITGAFGGAMDMFNSMSSGAGWLGIMMDLISQTEAYTELMSILSDNVLPVLNAFLEPLLPLIEELGSVIILITKSVLEPLFPVLKAIAKIAVFVIGMLKITFGFVEDVIKKIVGTVQYGVLTVYNWIVRTLKKINIFGWQPFGWMGEADTTQAKEWMETDILGNAKDRWDEMNEHLASIDKMTMDIEKNTSKSDTKAYDDMYNKGVLSFSEYTALLADINGKKYDNVYTLSGSEYYRGSGGTTNINYGGIEIKIDGTNLSADQIAEKVQKKLEEMKRPGQMAYA